MTKTALLIVDLQEDFLPPSGSLAVKDGRQIIHPIIELLDLSKYNWDVVVATKDWHPADHISFAKTHNQEPYTTKMLSNPVDPHDKKEHVLWPSHCVQGSPGSEFPAEFTEEFDKLLKKQTVPTKIVLKGYIQDREYYSCFQDVWGLHKTECAEFLKEHAITEVYAVGIAYDYCVLNSCIDSSKLGFKTFVVKDYTRAVYPEKNTETGKIYSQNGVSIINSDDPEMKRIIK